MNKRERNSMLKDIIKSIDSYLKYFESTKNTLNVAMSKLDDLDSYMDDNMLKPESWDLDELKTEILVDYFENDSDISEILGLIEGLQEEVRDYINDMSENATYREEWEEFDENLSYIEECIDIESNEILSVEDYEEALNELRDKLKNLI